MVSFLLAQLTGLDGCSAALGLSYASAGVFAVLVMAQALFHLTWASPAGMKAIFFVPQILSVLVLVPGRLVLAAAGHHIDSASLFW